MKLAIVIGSLSRGGSERQVVELVRSAHPRSAECVVVCLSADRGDLAAEVSSVGANVLTVGFEGARWRGAPKALARLARILRSERPDVVYAFLFWSQVLALPLAAAFAPRATRVAALRSSPKADVPRNGSIVPLRRAAFAVAHGAIANSDALALEWARSYRRLRGRVRVVPNGVRLPKLDSGPTSGQTPTLICVANLIRYKGHATLFEALAGLKDLEWTLLLAGDGPERGPLGERARQLGLDGRVRFLGVRPNVDALLSVSDLAVLPSYTEGLPNAVLEAMASGLPVVATDVGGVREALRCGGGTVVPARDSVALRDAIRLYLRDPALRSEVGSVGRQEAERRYRIESMRDLTLAALEAFGK
jgi:glycosyltransferase involved in cell wall biosynthesis